MVKKIFSILLLVGSICCLFKYGNILFKKPLAQIISAHNDDKMVSSAIQDTDEPLPSHKIIIDSLQEQEKQLWNVLEQEGVSYNALNEFKRIHKDDYLRNEQSLVKKHGKRGKVSQEMLKLIKKVCADCAIDFDKITVVPWDLGSAAAATQNYLFVNERYLNKHDFLEKQWIIAHELMHVRFDDHCTNFILRSCFHEEMNDVDHPANDMVRFQEIRADSHAALLSSDYAKGYVEFFDKHTALHNDTAKNDSHPCSFLRLKTAKNIFDQVYSKEVVYA